MAYTIISQNNTTTTLSDENGNVITVPARVTLATSTDYTIKKVNNNSVDLESGDGKIIRGVPACVVLAGEGGGGGSSLPDQTGQSGKFLTTDGTDASWSDKPLVNKATGTSSLAIGSGSTSVNGLITIGTGSSGTAFGTAIGIDSYSQINATAVGQRAKAQSANSIAFGYSAMVGINGTYAIQLGSTGLPTSNSDANTFKVANANGNFEIMSADGTVPTARLTKVNTTATLAAGSANWTNNEQTVTVSGVKADSVVFVSPDPTSASDYASAGILCTSQSAGTLTFTATTTPSVAIDVNIVCL